MFANFCKNCVVLCGVKRGSKVVRRVKEGSGKEIETMVGREWM